MDIEAAVVVLEGIAYFLHKVREFLGKGVDRRIALWSLAATVEKHVFLAGMSVHVDIHNHLFLLVQITD